LREAGTDEFWLTWAFEICDLNELLIAGIDQHPDFVAKGSKDQLMYRFDMICDNAQDSTAAVYSMKITYTGSAPTDISPNGIKLYLDSDRNNMFEPIIDTLLSSGSLGTGREVIMPLDNREIIYGVPQRIFCAVDINETAYIGTTVSLGVSSSNDVEIIQPDRCAYFDSYFSGGAIIADIPTVTSTPTHGPTMTATITATPTTSPTLTPTETPDFRGPSTTDCFPVTGFSIQEGTLDISIIAQIDNTGRGGEAIIAAEYFIGTIGPDGSGSELYPIDSVFDSAVEWVETGVDTSSWTAVSSPYHISIHGEDTDHRWGEYCEFEITVYKDTPTPGPMPIPVSSGKTQICIIILISMVIALLFWKRESVWHPSHHKVY